MPSKSKKSKPSQPGPTTRSALGGTASVPAPTKSLQPPKHDRPSPHHVEDLASPPPDGDLRTGDTTESAGEPASFPAVNRKKQKRREKEAAKKTAEEQALHVNGRLDHDFLENGHVGPLRPGRGPAKGYFTEETDYVDPDFQGQLLDGDEEFYSNDDDDLDYDHSYPDGPDHSWLNTSKRKKGAKRRSRQHLAADPSSTLPKPFPTLSNAALRSAHKMSHSNDHIWNTSTQAERENIKQFWLELGEDERRSLVRVEKEAVLRKMKEQQKHSCSCSVCGRKRTAIEEELEVLYDAYYQELEQFANHDHVLPDSPSGSLPPSTPVPYRNQPHPMAGAYPGQGSIQELGVDGEDLDDEDDYDEDDDEDDYSDDYDDDLPPGPADFFQFGNSLTVKDGILTVADDLLKNDGKHFIDMMEQLAERRMQREEEIHYPAPPLAHQSLRQGHSHPPLDEDDDYDDEEDDDEDYDSQEEEDFEADDMDSMTEEQRMEEGRRMFQIFAARMFEQRVLTAYKEKVAAERQKKLLEELEAEGEQTAQREAKKAKDAAKKKEKKARQKAVKDEEKAKKEAEKAALEAAARAAEEKKAAEKRAKQEDQRRKREAERKVAEEERMRKEAEKVARAQKERERQQEAERKAREAKEREKRLREEQRQKEREEKEAKEAEARAKRAKEDQGRRERELQQRRDKDDIAKADREANQRQKADQSVRPQPVALPPGLAPTARTSSLQSPHVPAATPLVAQNIPNPASRNRQISQPSQQSHTSSPRSQKASTEASQASASPANVPLSHPPIVNQPPKHSRQGPPLHHPQPNAPRSPLSSMGMMGRGGQPHAYGGLHGAGSNGAPISMPGSMPMNAPMHMFQGPSMTNPQRFPPNGLPFPPGFNALPRPFPQNQHPPPFHQPPPLGPVSSMSAHSQAAHQPAHSRQPSGSDHASQPAPIARPGPIARPSSATPDRQKESSSRGDVEIEKMATQLGSSALLDDSDGPLVAQLDNRAPPSQLGVPGTSRLPFANTFANDKASPFIGGGSSWGGFSNGGPGAHFGQPPRPGPSWSQPMFDPIGSQAGLARPHMPRPIAVRLMLVQACKQLTSAMGGKGDEFHPAQEVLHQVKQMQQPGEPAISLDELLGICDTEGNVQNGGGMFEVTIDAARGGQIIKFVADDKPQGSLRNGLGDIGSPILPPGSQVSSFGSIGQGVQHQGFRPHPPGRNF